tara:strand:+ start:289 stop:546 length:258 start_codon:yes stop_codon:yes gene_type:complete
MQEFLGFLYTMCFAFCFWPQIYKALKRKKVDDVSPIPYGLASLGYISASAYTIIKIGFDFWLLINYGLSLLSATVMLCVWFKYKK